MTNTLSAAMTNPGTPIARAIMELESNEEPDEPFPLSLLLHSVSVPLPKMQPSNKSVVIEVAVREVNVELVIMVVEKTREGEVLVEDELEIVVVEISGEETALVASSVVTVLEGPMTIVVETVEL